MFRVEGDLIFQSDKKKDPVILTESHGLAVFILRLTGAVEAFVDRAEGVADDRA